MARTRVVLKDGSEYEIPKSIEQITFRIPGGCAPHFYSVTTTAGLNMKISPDQVALMEETEPEAKAEGDW